MTHDDGTLVTYRYSASGERVEKKVVAPDSTHTTRYLRDASGNVLAIYENDSLTEQPIYGSSRLGVYRGGTVAGQQTLGNRQFELTSNTQNVMAVITDQVNLTVDSAWATVVSIIDYYPSGLMMAGRIIDNGYRYGFGSHERDDEIKGSGKHYSFSDYGYDPKLVRRWRTDPAFNEYPSISPYAALGNNPLAFVDPDGQRILFVNGHYQNNWFGRNILGADKPGRQYWGAGFVSASQGFFNDYSSITNDNFIDGSSMVGIDQSGSDRYSAGYAYAKNNLKKITAGMIQGETFKIVTHSEGAAYGAGVASYLIEQGHKVEYVVHLSADEGDEFTTPKEPTTYQLGYDGDWVTGNKLIEGVDKSGIVDSGLGWQYVHGSTRGKRSFNELEDLRKVRTYQFMDGEGKIHYAVDKNSTPNGTKFNRVNDLKIEKP